MTVLCLVELDGTEAADVSLRALTLARTLGDPSLGAVVFADSALVPAAALADYGVTDVYVIEPGSLDGYAPQAWARALAGLATETGATAVLAAGTDRGNEVLAHLGAITGLPMAANCTVVTPDGGRTHRIVRHRWAGLLLEHAVMEAPVALFTVATDAVAPVPVGVSAETPASVQLHVHKPELAEADLVVRAAESAGRAGGASLATARVVVGGGRGVGGPDGFPGAVPGLRHQRRDPAHRGLRRRQAHHRDQHRRGRPHPGPRRLRRHRRPAPGHPGPGGGPSRPLTGLALAGCGPVGGSDQRSHRPGARR
jgi:electron transfer flavoprotein alpha subunit